MIPPASANLPRPLTPAAKTGLAAGGETDDRDGDGRDLTRRRATPESDTSEAETTDESPTERTAEAAADSTSEGSPQPAEHRLDVRA